MSLIWSYNWQQLSKKNTNMIHRNPDNRDTLIPKNIPGIVDMVDSRKKALWERISLQSYTNIIKEIREAQTIILEAILGNNEQEIKWNSHVVEIALTTKNKYLARNILYSVWILYAYENEENPKKIQEGIDTLSPENIETNDYTLRIYIERRTEKSSFYIQKIDITK